MSFKNLALVALASTALAGPAYASNVEIDMLMKEINKLKSQVNALQKRAAEPAPSVAPAQKPVVACEAQGNGFFVIPGTASCLRISGYARAESSYQEVVGNPNGAGVDSGSAIDASPLTFAGRLRLNTDFRSSTAMGTLRGFGRLNLNLAGNSSFGLSSSTGATEGSQAAPLSTAADLEYAYVSLGGWSIGRQDSVFSFFSRADSADLIVADDNLKILAGSYTLPIASGLSVTFALENPLQRSGTAPKEGEAGWATRPEIVGAVQMISGAATFKFSGASHQVVRESNGATADGYALQGGMKYVMSPETTVWLQGTYANGAMSYLGYGISNSSAGDMSTPDEAFRLINLATSGDFNYSADPSQSNLSSGWSALGSINQKIGSGNLALIGVYGDIENSRRGATGVEGTVMQLEANYTYRPFEGLNIQPAVSYQRWDIEEIDGSPDYPVYDRVGTRIRVWREF
jgi:hypothetical protein